MILKFLLHQIDQAALCAPQIHVFFVDCVDTPGLRSHRKIIAAETFHSSQRINRPLGDNGSAKTCRSQLNCRNTASQLNHDLWLDSILTQHQICFLPNRMSFFSIMVYKYHTFFCMI